MAVILVSTLVVGWGALVSSSPARKNATFFLSSLFGDISIWKAGAIEFIGTFLLMWMIIITTCSVIVHQKDYTYFPGVIALVMVPVVAFMIFATATTSGGHLNPTISFATMLAGLTEFPRFVIYVLAQVTAAILASLVAKSSLPSATVESTVLAMCSIGTQQTEGEALTLEIICDFWILFIAFGVALDERYDSYIGVIVFLWYLFVHV